MKDKPLEQRIRGEFFKILSSEGRIMSNKPIERKILDELLKGEFNKGLRVGLYWCNLGVFSVATAYFCEEPEKFGHININSKFKERLIARQDILKEVLRHELLHIELKATDSDSRFKRIAQKRGIIWNKSDTARIGRELNGWSGSRPIIHYACNTYNANQTMTLSMAMWFPLETGFTTSRSQARRRYNMLTLRKKGHIINTK